jgi:hypothetical protein
MLNLVTFDINDRKLLEKSYEAIKHKEDLEIIIDEREKEKIFQQTINAVKIPTNATFSFQNLFKISLKNGPFFIAQCLMDFGYPIGTKGSQSHIHQYNFQLIGIADLNTDIGVTYLRMETWLDKFTSRFFDKDIDFSGAEKFNNKYHLISDKQKTVRSVFDKAFLNCIAKYDNVLLTTNNKEMYISFNDALTNNQSRIVEDIFSNCNLLIPG